MRQSLHFHFGLYYYFETGCITLWKSFFELQSYSEYPCVNYVVFHCCGWCETHWHSKAHLCPETMVPFNGADCCWERPACRLVRCQVGGDIHCVAGVPCCMTPPKAWQRWNFSSSVLDVRPWSVIRDRWPQLHRGKWIPSSARRRQLK